MQIYIGDGEYAESPGEDAEEAYDNWLFHIARENDDEDIDGTPDFDPNCDDDEDWGDD